VHTVPDYVRRTHTRLGAVRRAVRGTLPRVIGQRDEDRRAGDEDKGGRQARAVGGK